MNGVLLLLLLSATVAEATTFSGKVVAQGTLTAPSSLAIGPTGTIEIMTVGENTANPSGSAPWVDVWVDAQSATVKTALVSGLAPGAHVARAELRHGLKQSVSTCTYPQGGSPCTVPAFTDIADANCDLTKCDQALTVTAGQVTRVVFKHRGVYQGWGATTVGGRDGGLLTVSNLNASGAGSLRQALIDACAANNKYIVFTVAGTIVLPHTDAGGVRNGLKVCGNQITVDGFTAPDPGITVTQYGLNIHTLNVNSVVQDTRDIILRGFRVRKNGFLAANCDGTPPDDCELQVVNIETGSSAVPGPPWVHNIVLDHMSISGGRDDIIGVSRDSHDITISYSYLSNGFSSNQGYLQDTRTNQITLHHNRWSRVARRNPQITFHSGNPCTSCPTDVPSTVSADVRYNTTVAYKDGPAASHWGVLIAAGAKANIVGNYFTADTTLAGDAYGANNAIIVCNPGSQWLNSGTMNTCDFCSSNNACRRASDTFVDGNVIDAVGYGNTPPVDMNNADVNVGGAISSPAVTGEATATLGACAVRQKGGARPLDAHDVGQEAFYANPC